MKKNQKRIVTIGVTVIAVAVLLTVVFKNVGGNLDVIGSQSVASLDQVMKAVPDSVKADEMNGGWALTAPDGTARFIWSSDFSKSPAYDVMLETFIKPFADAGLDKSKLPGNYVAYEDKLLVGTKLGNDALTYDGEATPLMSYGKIVKKYRAVINYHTALDHYGVMLGDGNMFEWAKDLSINTVTGAEQDKDIVFVLNPDPLIAAGVDPSNVAGWAYAQVEVEEDGKPVNVYKFLKPFNLK